MSAYTTELGDLICEKTSTSSIGLRHICAELNIPYSTVTDWIYNKSHELSGKYTKAKQRQMLFLAEELLEIADDGSNDLMTIVKGDISYEQENKEVVNRSRLRVDTRKWLMSKLAPKIFGDKLDVTLHDRMKIIIKKSQPLQIDQPNVEDATITE